MARVTEFCLDGKYLMAQRWSEQNVAWQTEGQNLYCCLYQYLAAMFAVKACPIVTHPSIRTHSGRIIPLLRAGMVVPVMKVLDHKHRDDASSTFCFLPTRARPRAPWSSCTLPGDRSDNSLTLSKWLKGCCSRLPSEPSKTILLSFLASAAFSLDFGQDNKEQRSPHSSRWVVGKHDPAIFRPFCPVPF